MGLRTLRLDLDDQDIIVSGDIDGLSDELCYDHKKWNVSKQRTEIESVAMSVPVGDNMLSAPAGLWGRIEAWGKARGVRVVLNDLRENFPKPDFSKMHGFRFSQSALLKQMLSANRSGLLEAPTRYGKTTLIINTIRAFPGIKTVVTAPGIDLLKQLEADLKLQLPERDVQLLYGDGRKRIPSQDVTVCSMDSLGKCDLDNTQLLICDEPHSVCTEGRTPLLQAFKRARRYGFGATMGGRSDNKASWKEVDIRVEALFGPILARRTFVEAVEEGAICPIDVLLIDWPVPEKDYATKSAAFGDLFWENAKLAEALRDISGALPSDWQTVFFISNEDQADYLQRRLGESGHRIAMAKVLTTKGREELFSQMASGEVTRAIASTIYSTGVTFPNLRVVVNVDGVGAYISAVQKPGRLAEIRPGKKSGILIDFAVRVVRNPTLKRENMYCSMLEGLSRKRQQIYAEKGYRIHRCNGDSASVLGALINLL